MKTDQHPDHVLSDWLTEFHANNDAEYLFQVQLCENLVDQPVEYAGKVWDSEKYPWQTVGRIIIPKQDSMIPARKTFWEGRFLTSQTSSPRPIHGSFVPNMDTETNFV